MPLFVPTITELGYAENVTDFSTANTGGVDITGVTLTISVPARPIVIQYGCLGFNDTSTDGTSLALFEDAVNVATMAADGSGVNKLVSIRGDLRKSPSVGSHTYKLQLAARTGGTTHAFGTLSPTFLRIRTA